MIEYKTGVLILREYIAYLINNKNNKIYSFEMYLLYQNLIIITICLLTTAANPQNQKDNHELLMNFEKYIKKDNTAIEIIKNAFKSRGELNNNNDNNSNHYVKELNETNNCTNKCNNEQLSTTRNIPNFVLQTELHHNNTNKSNKELTSTSQEVTNNQSKPQQHNEDQVAVTTLANTENTFSKNFSNSKLIDGKTEDTTIENIANATDFDEKMPVTTTTTTMAKSDGDDKSSRNENILTELTKLSSGDDDLNTGQKIEMKSSNAENSDSEVSNPDGVKILEETSRACGSLLGKRISFANETTLMEYPWTALLLYNTKERYHCGGSLITTKYVLTAAHCVAQQFYELSGVRLGEHDVTTEKDCAEDIGGGLICSTTVDVKVIKIIIHHGYSHLSFKNDIALLKLDGTYYTRSYYPICLSKPDTTFTGKIATVAGWGATEKTLRSNVLQQANVPVLDISKCQEIYRYSKFNDSTEICGSGVNEVDVCKGDSGGAIFYRKSVDGREKFFQLGIISLGVRRCGDSRFLPAVFTKLKGFYKWIENNLEY